MQEARPRLLAAATKSGSYAILSGMQPTTAMGPEAEVPTVEIEELSISSQPERSPSFSTIQMIACTEPFAAVWQGAHATRRIKNAVYLPRYRARPSATDLRPLHAQAGSSSVQLVLQL